MRRILRLHCFFFLLAVLSACGENKKSDAEPVAESSNDVSYFENQLKKHPDSLLLGQQLIQAYRNEGMYDSALSVTRSMIARDTGNAYLWNVMATLSYENGDTAATIHALEKAVSIYPLPDYYVALGTVYAEQHNPSALSIAQGLIDMPEPNANKADGYFIKGLFYNYNKEPAKAIAPLDSAIALNYTFMYAYREKAIAFFDMKKYRDAIRVLTRAVTLQNGYDEGYYWMGKAYEKLNKKDSAIQAYQNALLYDKNYTEAKEALDRLKNQNH